MDTIEIDLPRALILLRAARDILRKTDRGPFVLSAMGTTAFYDGAECDGFCLTEEIEDLLGLERYTPAIEEGSAVYG
jgi:hypothetical protein